MSASSSSASALSLFVRSSSSRGHGSPVNWLNTYHTFSFASYFDPNFSGFHSLRVLNEDRVKGGYGFDPHGHRDFEIFSYVISGSLKHTDSMKNEEIIERGEVQYTTAGTGIIHSEYNANPNQFVHFLQCWLKPRSNGLKPSYQSKSWSDADKLNQLRPIITPDGNLNTIQIQQDATIYASLLESGKSVEIDVKPGREMYLHLVQDVTGWKEETKETSLTVKEIGGGRGEGGEKEDRGVVLENGDGLFVKLNEATRGGKLKVTANLTVNGSDKKAEFLLFDLKVEAKSASTNQWDDDDH